MSNAHGTSRTGQVRPGRDGAILGVVLVLLMLVSLLGAGMVSLHSADAFEAANAVTAAQAFWCAEAGLAEVQAIANRNRIPFDSFGLLGQGVVQGTTVRGTYSVDIVEDSSWQNGTLPVKRYIVTSTGTSAAGETRRMESRLELWTFANFMLASHLERLTNGSRIYYGPEDLIRGPVYVNDQLNIYGDPRFVDMVRSAADSVHYESGGDRSAFEGGLQLGVPPLDFDRLYSVDPVDTIRQAAVAGGIALRGDYGVQFHQNGSMTVNHISGSKQTFDLNGFNGAIYIDGDAEVLGLVNGNVTLASTGTISIPNQGVQYASASKLDPFSSNFNPDAVDDSLGLVARTGVEITANHAVDIHAAIMITDDGPGFHAANAGSNISKNLLRLYGSISQYRRGIVGYANGKGFRKEYLYDTRFETEAPPFYPYSGYVRLDWRQTR